MTRKDLQEKYNIIGNNNDISLYRKRGEFNYGIGYCGNISLIKRKVVFNGVRYPTIEALDNALREWEKSLPWPVDTYNPMMRKGAVLEDRVIWYLTKKMGFKAISSNWQVRYSKEIGINSSISFIVDRTSMEDEKITIVCPFGPYTLRQEIAEVDEAVAMISSMVRQQVLQMASGIVEALSVCPNVEVPEMEAYVKSNRSLFGIERIDYRSMMVSLLEKELEKLRGE